MRVLVYRLGSLGDTVMALPCFHLIRQTHHTALITVLTNTPVSGKAAPLEAVLGLDGLIHSVIHYPAGLRDPRSLLLLGDQLRAEKFDLLISLAAPRGLLSSWRDLLFFKACGIPRVIGIPFRHRDLVCLVPPGENLYESEAKRLLRRIAMLGSVDLQDPAWLDLGLTVAEKKQSRRLLLTAGVEQPFLAVSIGTKSLLNDWGTLRWEQLLKAVSADFPRLGLILLGSAEESPRSAGLLKSWLGPGANFCGLTSPRLSAAVLARAALFVGHDSGPMHLAAASGTRCVTIFSARCPPGQWFPIGNGHINLYPLAYYDPKRTDDLAYQKEALGSIHVETVHQAIAEALLQGDGVSEDFSPS